MGWYVHIHVCIPRADAEIAKVAAKHLPNVSENHDAVAFLRALSEGGGQFRGPKGGLTLWGYVGNYVNGSDFVDVLRGFWLDLFLLPDSDGDQGIVLEHEHIVVFIEEEQSNRCQAYEIYLSDEIDRDPVLVTHHDLPFGFQQA